MKKLLFSLSVLLVACSNQDARTTTMGASMTTASSQEPHMISPFLPTASLRLAGGDGGPVQPGTLPVPVKSRAGLRMAVLFVRAWTPDPSVSPAKAKEIVASVSIPRLVRHLDPVTGQLDEQSIYLQSGAERFGIPDPPDFIVGRFDDTRWPPPERREALRARIFTALDVLLPLFADQTLPWTEAANKAAQEVRDFFPLAAEPGLWPYYKAEGREFFAWVEKNAPPTKARLPWE